MTFTLRFRKIAGVFLAQWQSVWYNENNSEQSGDILSAHILLVEDDAFLREGLFDVLTGEGYKVTAVGCLREAQTAMQQTAFSLVVLDVGLPDGSGLSFCAKLRAENNDVPVLFLTAFDEEMQIIGGLDAGGDDYVTKPFRLRELLSRVRALLRRSVTSRVDISGLQIDLANRSVTKDGNTLFLTPTEFQILAVLSRAAGSIVTRDVLLQNIWDDGGNYIDDNTLSVHVSRLREKIGADCIGTVRGVGYRLNK